MSRHQHSIYNLSYRNWSNDSKILNLSFCMTKFYFCRPGRPITYWSFRHGCYGYGGMARITIFHCFPYHLHFSYSFHCLYFSIWQVSTTSFFNNIFLHKATNIISSSKNLSYISTWYGLSERDSVTIRPISVISNESEQFSVYATLGNIPLIEPVSPSFVVTNI